MLLEMIYEEIEAYIENKKVLEILCGNGAFAKKCAPKAKKVVGTDVTLNQVDTSDVKDPSLSFQELDVAQVHNFLDPVDTVVCVDGLGHVEPFMELIVDSCYKKVINCGHVIIASTRQSEIAIIDRLLLPVLARKAIVHQVISRNKYKIVIF